MMGQKKREWMQGMVTMGMRGRGRNGKTEYEKEEGGGGGKSACVTGTK